MTPPPLINLTVLKLTHLLHTEVRFVSQVKFEYINSYPYKVYARFRYDTLEVENGFYLKTRVKSKLYSPKLYKPIVYHHNILKPFC